MPDTSGAAKEVPLPNAYAPAAEPGSGVLTYPASVPVDEIALSTLTPGATRERCEPVLENSARAPVSSEAPTESPLPTLPLEPTGWTSAAGYSTGFDWSCSLPTAATTSAPCLTA